MSAQIESKGRTRLAFDGRTVRAVPVPPRADPAAAPAEPVPAVAVPVTLDTAAMAMLAPLAVEWDRPRFIATRGIDEGRVTVAGRLTAGDAEGPFAVSVSGEDIFRIVGSPFVTPDVDGRFSVVLAGDRRFGDAVLRIRSAAGHVSHPVRIRHRHGALAFDHVDAVRERVPRGGAVEISGAVVLTGSDDVLAASDEVIVTIAAPLVHFGPALIMGSGWRLVDRTATAVILVHDGVPRRGTSTFRLRLEGSPAAASGRHDLTATAASVAAPSATASAHVTFF